MATMVREDMNTAMQGKILTIQQRARLLGKVQDRLKPSMMVRGMDRAIMRSDMLRFSMKMFLAVLLSFLLIIILLIPSSYSTVYFTYRVSKKKGE